MIFQPGFILAKSDIPPYPNCKGRKIILNHLGEYNQRRSFMTIRHVFDSRSQEWLNLLRCIVEKIKTGTVDVRVISYGTGIFQDCRPCTTELAFMFNRIIAPEKKPLFYMKSSPANLQPSLLVDISRLEFIHHLLQSPTRPACGSPECPQSSPSSNDLYVTTLRIYFADCGLIVKYFSKY
jgi:hypothetical protein